MTFDELQEVIGPQDKSGWHQHKNGGGWVQNSVKIDKSCLVGESAIVFGNAQVSGDAWVYGNAQVSGDAWVYGNAQVYGDARVSGNAQVSGDARVYGNARVSGDAWVYGNAQVYGNARVYGNAQVSGDAQVSGNARVYGNAQVSGDAWEKPPLFIVGSKHSLTNSRHGFIKIGCHEKSIAWWQEHFCSIGKKESYTAEEIEEYGHYIDLFAKVAKREGPHADG